MAQSQYVDSHDAFSRSIEVEDCASIDEDELDAHHQVLGMASAIEQLTQDFARQQEELAAAYKKLQQYALREQSEEAPRPRQNARSGGGSGRCGCSHAAELEEMKKLLQVKDLALAEALQQRNELRVGLEKSENLVAELRSLHLDTTNGRVPQVAWKVAPPVPGPAATSTISRSTRNATTAIQYSQATVGIRTPMTSAATAALLGCPGAIEVPHDERFDVESSYKQRKETGDTFWRKQYKEAVRMRKVPSPSCQQSAVTTQQNAVTTQPSLKIFSSRDNRKKKTDQLRDETVPSSRYIGISSKQNNIIKEQHRMLAKE